MLKQISTKTKKSLIAMFALVLGSLSSFAQDVAEEATAGPGMDNSTILFYLLVFAAGVMFFVVINKTLKALELSYELNGKSVSAIWNKVNGLFFFLFGFLLLGLTLWEMKKHGAQILPESASEHGLITDGLFSTTLIITGIVYVLTHILLFYFSFKYKHSTKRRAFWYPHNDKLEMYWTVIPAIVLTVLVVMGWKTWNGITKPAPKDAAVVEITGKQFAWVVRYPGADRQLGDKNFKLINDLNEVGVNLEDKKSADDVFTKEIHIVVGKPVRFVFGARDVIHSAYMPHFRMQMNCVPGMPTTFWMTPRTTTSDMRDKLNDPKFDYILLCAKICGNAHFNMQMKVVVDTQEEYNKWMETQKPYFTEEVKTQIKALEAEKASKVAPVEGGEHAMVIKK